MQWKQFCVGVAFALFGVTVQVYAATNCDHMFFSTNRLPPVVSSSYDSFVLFDVDGDSDLDMAFSQDYRQPDFSVWTNIGSGRFYLSKTNSSDPGGADNAFWLKAADLDLDGDEDIVAFGGADSNKVFINLGSGNFTNFFNFSGNSWNFEGFASLTDMNGDGYPDAVAAKIWTNDHSGRFYAWMDLIWFHSFAVGDLDGDGDPDLVLAEGSGLRFRENLGGGVFSAGFVLGEQAVEDIAVADMEGDGDLDLITVGPAHSEGWHNEKFWENLGSWNFSHTYLPGTNYLEREANNIWTADLDGDGDPDFITYTVWGNEVIWENDGAGGLSVVLDQHITGPPRMVEFGDVDGDGDLDFATHGGNGYPVDIFENAGCDPDLSVNKSVNDSTPAELASVAFSLVVTNRANVAATGISIRDAWPTQMTFGAASGGQYSLASGVWTIGTLQAGSHTSITLQGSVKAGTAGKFLPTKLNC